MTSVLDRTLCGALGSIPDQKIDIAEEAAEEAAVILRDLGLEVAHVFTHFDRPYSQQAAGRPEILATCMKCTTAIQPEAGAGLVAAGFEKCRDGMGSEFYQRTTIVKNTEVLICIEEPSKRWW